MTLLNSRIVAVRAREILDSRGNPTVEAEVRTKATVGRASVPSGASTGSHEAIELRDGDPRRFHGKGVKRAVANVEKLIGPALKGKDSSDIRSVDGIMTRLDGTSNKGRLGANAILAVSMAVTRAGAKANGRTLFDHLGGLKKYRLPVPMMNVVNGGEHADNGLAVQEFVIEPVGAETCSDAIRMGSEVYHSLKKVLTSKYGGGATNVGDEGGFAPPMTATRDALEAMRQAIRASGYGENDVRLGIDAAASTFRSPKGKYTVDEVAMDAGRLEDYYASLRDEYGLLTIEDPFGEEDYDAFASITKRLGKKTKIIGDDLYVTSVPRIANGFKEKSTNAVLVKLNQVGSVSETMEAIRFTHATGWAVAVSHRSGETEDAFISHLATAMEAEFIKAGAPARGERVEKFNELLRIEEELGARCSYAGKEFRR